MKTKHLVLFDALTILEGIVAIVFLQSMQLDAGRGKLINYPLLRLGLEILVGLFLIVLGFLLARLLRNSNWAQTINNWLDKHLVEEKPRLFMVQGTLLILALFLVECFLLTYLSFPVPFRPLFVWAALICLQAWLSLRLVYDSAYRQRVPFFASLKAKWNEWKPVQRQTFSILLVIGLIYFLAFIPLNYLRDNQTHFYIHPDEGVIYPDVAKVLIWQGSFDATVHNILDGWQWWYGYPYLPMSAVALIIPRLVFGESFVQQMQLNLLLLRQFVSVLPMTLALLLIVYLVTRFERKLFSIGMFIFLLLIPGVMVFNFHFWHPDGIILLLIILTAYFLDRDRLRFGVNFYLAAAACALAIAIKLWGAFFVLAIAGYLIAGWQRKVLTFKKMVLAGTGFLLVMVATIAISSPTLLVPYVTRGALEGWQSQQNWLLTGYQEPDPEGVYKTGLANWLKYFNMYYMTAYVFFISFASLGIGSLFGSKKSLNRIILAWCIATGIFLVNFASMKSNQYMIPLMLPLYIGLFLIPYVGQSPNDSKDPAFLRKPITQKLLWGFLILVAGSQFALNVYTIATSRAVGISYFISTLH
jgi:hypothetical protein